MLLLRPKGWLRLSVLESGSPIEAEKQSLSTVIRALPSNMWRHGSRLSIGHLHLAAGIGATGACPIARICQKH